MQICENPEKIRQKESYLSTIEVITENEIDLKSTKGIKKYCVFNDLQNFHIFDNFSVDIMHDVNEGVIPFFMNKLLFMIKNKISTLADIQAKVRDFNYGILNKKYKPSKINLEKHNLGQNAKQIYCIMIFLPFILINYRPKLLNIWNAMEKLLQIMQIIYSTCIRKTDIERLKDCIEEHLTFLVNKLNVNLIPKHHIMLHYPSVIHKMGPLIHMWMMRMESKHKVFTDMVKITNNFVNITKTLAHCHQQRLCNKKNIFAVKTDRSKTVYNISKTQN